MHVGPRRLLAPFALAALALTMAACGTDVPGNAIPAAGFTPAATPSGQPARPTSSIEPAPTTPVIPTTRDLTGIDLCTLLTEDDLVSRGGLVGQPTPRTELFPESCSFPLGGATGNAVLVAFYRPYEQVRAQQPDGHEESALGHSTWIYCAATDGYQTCVAAVAVRVDRTVVVAMSIRDASADNVVRTLEPLTSTVLNRLPPG